jgi:hypothetical protein
VISGDRNVSISAHVTQIVKTALERTSAIEGKSMSAYISDAIEAQLKSDGADLTPPEKEDEPELPFEGQ